MVNTVQREHFTEVFEVGVKERQEREREATARAILDAARELFVAEGYQNVSIRKIAERIEYSPAAIYSYFESKDDIFLALAEEGFRLLFESAEKCACSADPEATPTDCIRNAFLDVYEFSKAHPEYHALMFMDRSVPKISQDWQRFGFVREMRGQLTNRIQQAIDLGEFPADSTPEAIFRVLMVAVLGVCMIRLCDRMAPGEDADVLARTAIDAVLTGFRTGFTHSYRPDNRL
jgi:AcrR family transcriptional regulator